MTVYEKLMKCYECVREKIDFEPEIALVLGSGLGDYANKIKIKQVIPYEEIDGFPVSTVSGHEGRFVFGYVEEVPVVIMQGRIHYYEGYCMADVVLPTRLMKLMGASVLFLTNAAGGLSTEFSSGDFMMITDHIASFIPNPLIGENLDELGPRFPDMSEIYDESLQEILRETAARLGIPLKEGVYVQFTGPMYESKAEMRLAQLVGAKAVGMSTACEAIVANHMGMKICAISCISNLAAGLQDVPLSHEEVQEAADKAASKFEKLITQSILEIHKKFSE